MEETNTTPTLPPLKSASDSKTGLFQIVILLIAVISLVLAALAWWQLHQANHHWRNRLWQLHQQVNKQQAALSDMQQSVNQLSQQASNQAEDWVLDEVLYLLKLAQYNLMFLNDTELAANLLNSANQNLTDLNDSSLLTTQQTITDALTQLSSTPPTDIANLLLQINALSAEIPQLPFAPNRLPKPTTTAEEAATPTLNWWHRLLQNLKQVVIVHRLQRPIVPLLSPEQRGYLVENIQYQLSQAQWAILHQQQQLYKTSIKQALSSIQDNFLLDNDATQTMLKTLQQLAKINVQPQVPNIASAITALRQVIAARAIHSPRSSTTTTPPISAKSHSKSTTAKTVKS